MADKVYDYESSEIRVTYDVDRLADGTGRDLGYFGKVAFCRCGESATKPFGDGTHFRVGFTAD
jgi:CDGSH-type Zn-finger protein